jgi:penicillin-binding protein 1A
MKKNKILTFFKFFFLSLFFLALVIFFLFLYYGRELPRPEKFSERKLIQSSKIYDRTGKFLLFEIYGEEKRTWVPLDKIPDYLKKAVISVEDKDFYSHFGIDLKSLARSILINLKIKKALYGGSTITQQLVRSTFLSNQKTVDRKIKEIILSIELDRRYSKDQILEWYLNQIPFGQNCYGVEAASQTYFGKSVSEISLEEAAVLAALIKAPSLLSPYGQNKKQLLERKDYVLDRMVSLGYLKKEEAEEAKRREIKFLENKVKILAPHFTLWVKQKLEKEYGRGFLEEEGLKIYTTLDWNLQKLAEETIAKYKEKNKAFNAFNSSLVAIDPKTGEILAMVGSAIKSEDWPGEKYPKDCQEGKNCLFEPEFNVAVSLPGRQPGSAFKPFIYAAAFEKGYDDKFLVSDNFTNFGLWGGKEYYPENYDGKFRGNVSLREALAQSLNVPSIKVLYLVGSDEKLENLFINDFKGKEEVFLEGLKKSISLAREMGISTLEKPASAYGPSIVLGGGEVKLLEMVEAYGVFANEGLFLPYKPILKIEDSKGNIIYKSENNPKRVISSKSAELITDILSDNEARAPIFGLRSPLYFENLKVAAKTGTTQNFKDAWTIGYTDKIVVGVWVGNNDGTPIKKAGVMVAAPIFHEFLESFYRH